MRALICGVVIIVVAGIAGCGGGGGGQTILPTTLSSDLVGTYQVKGIDLPGDRIGVSSNGDVLVDSDTPATKASSQVKIGSCDARGVLALNGSWTSGGTDYSISATGSIDAASHSVSLQATVTRGNQVVKQGTAALGERVEDTVLPPPPPDYPDDDDDDGMLPPPPPPYDSGGGTGGDMPPPPPYSD